MNQTGEGFTKLPVDNMSYSAIFDENYVSSFIFDLDGDGVFDKSTIFADQMTMPEGGLWHNGALYIISAPYLWRLEDVDDDGVADKREKILGSMEFDGRANQHGPYLGPNGRLYFS